jgi:hypothetical protein
MLQKMGCRFDTTERLIESSAFERATNVPPGPCHRPLAIDRGRQRAIHAGYWELDWLRAQDLEARGASASGCIELLNDDRLAADGSQPRASLGDKAGPPIAHPPAPGMKHLIETDGLIPLTHDR